MTTSPQAWSERETSTLVTLKMVLTHLKKLDGRALYDLARDIAWHHLTAHRRAAEAVKARRIARTIEENEPRLTDVHGSSPFAFGAVSQPLANNIPPISRDDGLEGPGVSKLQSLLLAASRKLSINGPDQQHPSTLSDAGFASPERLLANDHGGGFSHQAERKTASR